MCVHVLSEISKNVFGHIVGDREKTESRVSSKKQKEKEEEMNPMRCRIATVINLYIVACSVFFVRLLVSFVYF